MPVLCLAAAVPLPACLLLLSSHLCLPFWSLHHTLGSALFMLPPHRFPTLTPSNHTLSYSPPYFTCTGTRMPLPCLLPYTLTCGLYTCIPVPHPAAFLSVVPPILCPHAADTMPFLPHSALNSVFTSCLLSPMLPATCLLTCLPVCALDLYSHC